MKKIVSILLILLMLIGMFAGCASQENKEDVTSTEAETSSILEITDLRGRTVTVPSNPQKVVCIGASALRLYCYVGDLSKLSGVEDFEKNKVTAARPYAYANAELFSTLPSCGSGGPNSTADAEAILSCDPDVIFSLYSDVEAMDSLQKQTGIPVVCLSYGGSDPFSESLATSLTLIGEIMGREERVNEVLNYISNIKTELNQLSSQTSNESTVYLGNNTYNGGKGSFGDTLVSYALFRELNAVTIFQSDEFETNNPTLDYEYILSKNPDIVFIDIANLSKLKEEVQSNPDYFKAIQAFQNGQIYVQLPFNQYYTNIEIALADAFYLGKCIYPDAFSSVSPEQKYNEILTFLLGKELDYYSAITEIYGMGFAQISIEDLMK